MPTNRRSFQNRALESTKFVSHNDITLAWSRLGSSIEAVPGLLGGWIASHNYSSGGNRFLADLSNGAAPLLFVSAPTIGLQAASLIPTIYFDGTSYLHTTDAQFRLTGTEAHIDAANNGVTMGGWFRFDNAASTIEFMMSVYGAVGNYSFTLNRNAAGFAVFSISTDGTALISVTGTTVLSSETWYFVAGVFKPSEYISVTVDTVTTTNSGAIPASLFVGNGYFTIGGFSTSVPSSGSLMTGHFSSGFFTPVSLDAHLFSFYGVSRSLYK